ncbi:MAG: DUF1573 domain-containing protein, partial [Candidatus Omnitrophica bacterium]|nr:DUF1573 domain-containing protein [Candidatus Omnitrophota bacterium]
MKKSKILIERYLVFSSGLLLGMLVIGIFKNKNIVLTPRLEITPSYLYLKEIRPGQKLKITITLKNEGNIPLIIKRIRKSCSSCIEIKIDKNILLPQKSEKAEILFTLPQKVFLNSSIFRDFIVFHTNEKNQSFKILRIEGVIKPIYEIRLSVINFGIVLIEELPIQEKVFIGKYDENVQITYNLYKGNLSPSVLNITPNKRKNILDIVLNKSNLIGPIN